MNLREMIAAINRRVDDVILNEDGIEWLNAGQNKMAAEVEARFPQLKLSGNLDDTFVFPEKYHEIPVLYASAMYKAQDSSLGEFDNYMSLFADGLKTFSLDYRVPAQYRDDYTTEQFTATEGQTVFTITKNSYNERFGDLDVYINGRIQPKPSTQDNNFTLATPAKVGDMVTASWEIHDDLIEPPYSWWGRW